MDSKTETVSDMDSLRRHSPIHQIHIDGYQAIIDGDTMQIIGKVLPDDVDEKMAELSKKYDDVDQDADGDIVCYRDI